MSKQNNLKEKIEQKVILNKLENLIITNKDEHQVILAQVLRTNGSVKEHNVKIDSLEKWKNRLTGGLLVINIVVLPVVFYLLYQRLEGK
jgi:hypothetical protein